ncbi:phytanoyl-CoA dioxygenase family protein [Cohnella soli]|uniref:Phytanoyl-CoA dioxygenase family protein n=1 Tax=Cohnella soli TaxID=425005 RepID=A0ABW0I1F1_9BACL
MLSASSDMLSRIRSHGYVHLKNGITLHQIEAINSEHKKAWLEQIAAGKIKQDTSDPLHSLFPPIRDLHYDNPTIRDFVLSPALFQLMEFLIGEEPLIITTNYYYYGPGMRGMNFHQDNYGIGVSPGTCYALWIGLDQAALSYNCLRFAKNTESLTLLSPEELSLKYPGNRMDHPVQYEDVETAPGDFVIYNGQIVHATTDNTTDTHIRRSLVIHYAPRSAEKLVLNFNKLLNRNGEKVKKRADFSSRQ